MFCFSVIFYLKLNTKKTKQATLVTIWSELFELTVLLFLRLEVVYKEKLTIEI